MLRLKKFRVVPNIFLRIKNHKFLKFTYNNYFFFQVRVVLWPPIHEAASGWSLLWEESLFSVGNKCTFWASGILVLLGLWGDTLFLGPFPILNLMEELANQLTNFSLSEKETVGFTLSKEQRSDEYLLVAQFLTPCFLNMEAMARTFKQLWRSTNRFTICNQNEHRVLFVFDNPNDIERILKNQPWSFDKHLVMLQRYSTNCSVRDLVFFKNLILGSGSWYPNSIYDEGSGREHLRHFWGSSEISNCSNWRRWTFHSDLSNDWYYTAFMPR